MPSVERVECRLEVLLLAALKANEFVPHASDFFSSGGVQMQGLAVAGTMCEGAEQRARTGSQCCLRTHRLPSCATSLVLALAAW